MYISGYFFFKKWSKTGRTFRVTISHMTSKNSDNNIFVYQLNPALFKAIMDWNTNSFITLIP